MTSRSTPPHSHRPDAEPTYWRRLRAARSDELFMRMVQRVAVEKKYLDPTYSAARLAAELHISPRYISAVVALHTGMNWGGFINSYRLREACRKLRSNRYARYTAEEIGLSCGFASRQSFYLAFRRAYGITPRRYRQADSPAGTVSVEPFHSDGEPG